jgi:hypothetical protein
VIVDFDWKPGGQLFWKKASGGKLILAKLIAKAMNDYDDIVSIIVEKEGLSIITDSTKDAPFGIESEHWDPVIIIHGKAK